jgi:hypothetical protein
MDPNTLAIVTFVDGNGGQQQATLTQGQWHSSLGPAHSAILNKLFLPRNYSVADGRVGLRDAPRCARALKGTLEINPGPYLDELTPHQG